MTKEAKDYSPEEIAAITQYLKKVDQHRNAMVMGQALFEIGKSFGRVSYPALDRILRNMNSQTFLVAVPFDLQDHFNCVDVMTHQEKPFYLWICVNGQAELDEKLQEIGVSADQNQENLKNTGNLVTKPGTDIARSTEAPNN